MAESYSVKAILSAQDKGFTSTLKSASNTVNSLASDIKSGFAFGVLQGVGQKAFSVITSGVSGLFGEAMETSDAMHKLQAAMRFSGSTESEIQRIAGSTGTLKTYADKTVFSLQDVMSTFGALSANGIKDSDKMTESLGNAVAVYGGGAKEFSAVGLAFSQSMAAGKLNAQDWNQILNASPQLAGGLKKELQKLNPVLAKDFKGAMADGAITADLLGEAINNIGMQEAAKKAATSVTTWEGAIGNLKATVSSGLMSLYDSFAKSGLINVINGFTSKIGTAFNWLSTNIPKAINKIKPYWTAFKESFSGVGSEIWSAVKEIGSALGDMLGAFGSTKSVDGFKSVMSSVADVIKGVAGFAKDHAKEIATLIKWLPAIVIGIKGFKVAKSVAPGIVSFTKGVAGLASKGIGGIASKLFGISGAQKTVGAASVTSGTQMLIASKSYALMGVAVLAVAAGFALLAQSAIALASAGGGAIAVMVGLVGALVLLGVGMATLLKSLAPMSAQLMPAAMAMLAMGAAVLLVSAGFLLLATASIMLANAGGAAIAIMAVMVLTIALLAVGAAALAPMLAVGAVGLLAFGAAIALCGVGAVLAATGLVIIGKALPTLVEYGLQGAVSILALGAALIVFAAGAALAAVAMALLAIPLALVGAALALCGVGILSVGLGLTLIAANGAAAAVGLQQFTTVMPQIIKISLLGAPALLLLGAALTVFGAGAMVAGAGAMVLGVGLAVVSGGMVLLSLVLPLVTANAAENAVAFAQLALGLLAFAPAALLAGAGAIVLGAGLLVASVGILLCAAGMALLAASILIIGTMATAAAVSMLVLSKVLPLITANALSNMLALTVLAAGFVVLGAGALVAGAGLVVLGAGLLVAAVGILALGAAILVLSLGAVAASGAMALLSLTLPLITENALQNTVALLQLGAGLLVFGAGALVAGSAAIVLGAGLLVAAAGLLVFGAGMITAAAGTLVMLVAIKAINSSMKSIASNAKTTQKSLKSMQSAVKAVSAGLDALGDKAKSAMNKLFNAFDKTESKVKTAGKNVGTGFTKGMQSGLALAPAVAILATTQVSLVLKAGKSNAYKAGAFISQGFAQGMLSCLGKIQSAANKMVAAADKAIRAKAKIHSPAKITDKLGNFFGEGWVNGVSDKVEEAQRIAEKLVSIPNVETPELAFAYSGEMSADYDYYRNAEYRIVVPFSIDGKEFAKAEATYMQDELDKKAHRESRKHGKA